MNTTWTLDRNGEKVPAEKTDGGTLVTTKKTIRKKPSSRGD